MLFLISVDSNMADNFICFLSTVSDYCMVILSLFLLLVTPLFSWKRGCVFLWVGGDLTIVCGAFAVKPVWNRNTVVGLSTRLPLKRYKIHVCLRNFNYEIFVLNLAPCTFTSCCHIDPVSGISAQRGFKWSDVPHFFIIYFTFMDGRLVENNLAKIKQSNSTHTTTQSFIWNKQTHNQKYSRKIYKRHVQMW